MHTEAPDFQNCSQLTSTYLRGFPPQKRNLIEIDHIGSLLLFQNNKLSYWKLKRAAISNQHIRDCWLTNTCWGAWCKKEGPLKVLTLKWGGGLEKNGHTQIFQGKFSLYDFPWGWPIILMSKSGPWNYWGLKGGPRKIFVMKSIKLVEVPKNVKRMKKGERWNNSTIFEGTI